jgi:ABC-type molybdenum transport system ATPase subunit/photorepair protein PhrA
MAHIINAEIEGLAGKDTPTQIEFDRHVNIIYGLNGCGKTSLLKILHSAMWSEAELISAVAFREASVKIYSIDADASFTRKITKSKMRKHQPRRRERDMVSSRQIESVEREFQQRMLFEGAVPQRESGWTDIPNDPSRPVRWAHRYLPTSRLHVAVGRYLPSPSTQQHTMGFTEETLDAFFAQSLSALYEEYSSDLLRNVRDSQERGIASILKGVLAASGPIVHDSEVINLEKAYGSMRRFLERQRSPDVLGTYADFKAQYSMNPTLRSVARDIFRIEQEIDEAMAPRRELERLVQRLSSGKSITFGDREISVTASNGDAVPLATLSSGEKHLLRILVEALLAGPNTILIDEPEISLHVDWQCELVRTLQTLNPEAQFILATHSPEIMADVRDERITRL